MAENAASRAARGFPAMATVSRHDANRDPPRPFPATAGPSGAVPPALDGGGPEGSGSGAPCMAGRPPRSSKPSSGLSGTTRVRAGLTPGTPAIIARGCRTVAGRPERRVRLHYSPPASASCTAPCRKDARKSPGHSPIGAWRWQAGFGMRISGSGGKRVRFTRRDGSAAPSGTPGPRDPELAGCQERMIVPSPNRRAPLRKPWKTKRYPGEIGYVPAASDIGTAPDQRS